MERALVVHDNVEMAEQATSAIKRVLGEKTPVFRDFNFEHALELMDDDAPWSLVLLGSGTPATQSLCSGPNQSAETRKFIETVRARCHNVPIIVLAATDDQVPEDILRKTDRIDLVKYAPGFVVRLEDTVRALHGQRRKPSTLLELRITLFDGDSGTWEIRRTAPVPRSIATGSLRIDPQKFAELIDDSRDVEHAGADWKRKLESVGRRVGPLLFDDYSGELSERFFPLRAEVGAGQVRVLFILDSSRQQAMVEAIRDRGAREFWMLQAPIVRQYTSSADVPILFAEPNRRQPINCLLVNAHPRAGILTGTEWRADCGPLPEIVAETEAVAGILEEAKRRGEGIGTIKRIDLSSGAPGNTPDDLLTALEEGSSGGEPWHLVHFAGHSILGRSNKPGLVLDATLGSVLPFSKLANDLRLTQFLFVSSCSSADSNFITKAIEYSIPAIVGYRWKVDDPRARVFATTFYRELFRSAAPSFKSLDHAFHAARCAMHRNDPDDPTWASPLLLTQLQSAHFH